VYTNSHLQFIDPNTINLEDDTFTLFPYDNGNPGDTLVTSIRQFGILHPPIILQLEKNKHIILAGRKRIKAALELDRHREILCLCLPADTPGPQIFSIILEDALIGKQLSIVEQAVILEKAQAKCPQDEVLNMLKKLGHKPQKYILDTLIELLSLGSDALQAVHEGIIQQNNARKLLKLSAPDQKILVELITHLHLGGSKQKKLIELCTELIMRRKEALGTIINWFYPHRIMERNANIPQQTSALLDWLNKECYPKTSEAEANFERLVSQLNLPSHYRLQHSKSFEDDTVVLSINFTSFSSMQHLLPEIIKVSSRKTSLI